MRHSLQFAAASALFLTCAAAPRARADFVQIGSTYTVDNTNFVDTFSEDVTFDGTGVNKSIDGGKLFINDQVFQTGTSGAWIEFNFSTANGGPLAADQSTLWQTVLENITFTTPLIYDGFFSYFGVDGTPFSNILPGDFSDVETNPITGVGEVLGTDVTPSSPLTSIDVYVFADPYSILISQNNIDTTTANDFSLAFHVDLPNPVPEPAALTLLGTGVGSLFAAAWRRKRPAAASREAGGVRAV